MPASSIDACVTDPDSMATSTPRELLEQAKTFELLRTDAIEHGMLILGFCYGVSAVRLYMDAIEAMAVARKAAS